MKKTGISMEFVDLQKPLQHQLKDTYIIINEFKVIDKSIIDNCSNLKLIQQAGIGIDNIDIQHCTAKGIYVANVPMANAISVAEHALFLMLYLAKNIKNKANNDDTYSNLFGTRVKENLGTELNGKTLAIIGLGVTGLEVAKRARALGMKVIAVTKHPFTKKDKDGKKYFVDNIHGTENLSDAISNADIISIHTPLNQETEKMIGGEQLKLMKKTAYLINVARAPIVDKDALYTALYNKDIAGAAFDVFWNELPESNDKILGLDNFFLTPHIAGWTREAIESITGIITINIERMLRGQVPLTIVNQELIGDNSN
jgi:D-3-phosphoglycerate dehydrogenase